MYNMKKKFIICVFLTVSLTVYSQTAGPRRAAVAILPFEAGPQTASNANPPPPDNQLIADANALCIQLMNELISWDALNILTGTAGSEYYVRSRLERVSNQYVLSATTYETGSNRVMNSARQQGATITALSSQIFAFAAQVTENVPFPNYLLGRWRAVISMNDGPLTCILEFRSDRTIRVEQYDTWEHRLGTNALRYQGYGTGTYSYWGYARRLVRGVPVDGFVTISLKLDDALPKYSTVSFTRVNYNFNDDKSVFELIGSGFGCGDNYSGATVYPSQNVAYTRFTKIQ